MSAKKSLCGCGKLKDKRALQCKHCRSQEPAEKKCTGCNQLYLIEEFAFRTNGRGGFKRRSKCKECEKKEYSLYRLNNLEKCKERKRNYDQLHPEKVHEWSFKTRIRRMGLNPDEVIEYVNSHHGTCEICGAMPTLRKLAVDHCHQTNVLRGLLCSNCNTGIGMFKDNPLLLNKAAVYLEKNRGTNCVQNDSKN